VSRKAAFSLCIGDNMHDNRIRYDYIIIIIIFIIDPRTVLRYITYNRVLKNSKIRIRSGFRLRAL